SPVEVFQLRLRTEAMVIGVPSSRAPATCVQSGMGLTRTSHRPSALCHPSLKPLPPVIAFDQRGALALRLAFSLALERMPLARSRIARVDDGVPVSLAAFANVPPHVTYSFLSSRRRRPCFSRPAGLSPAFYRELRHPGRLGVHARLDRSRRYFGTNDTAFQQSQCSANGFCSWPRAPGYDEAPQEIAGLV